MIIVVPALYVLLSWGMLRTRERYFNLWCLLVLGAIALGAMGNWYFDPAFGKPPFRAVAEFLNEQGCDTEPVVHTSDGGFLILLRYAPQCEHLLVKGDPSPQFPAETYELFGGEIIEKEHLPAHDFWLLVALDNSLDFQRATVDWFDQWFDLTSEQVFDGVILRRYTDS